MNKILRPRLDIDPSVVLYMPMDGFMSGSKVQDRSQYHNHGTVYGAKFKYPGMSFDGENDRVNIPDSDILSFGDGSTDIPFTIYVWVKMKDATNFFIFSKSSNMQREYILGFVHTDQFCFYLYDDDVYNRIGAYSNTALTSDEGNWIHLAGVYDGMGSENGINLYRNGELLDHSHEKIGSYTAMHNHLELGVIARAANDVSLYSKGSIDEVLIYNRALSVVEIKSNYELMRWKFGV